MLNPRFYFGAVLAYSLHCGFVPIGKKETSYKTLSCVTNEYGEATLEIHRDLVRKVTGRRCG